jgi:hypothetical protein
MDNHMPISIDTSHVMRQRQQMERTQHAVRQAITASRTECAKANWTTSARRTFSGEMDVQTPHGTTRHVRSTVKD